MAGTDEEAQTYTGNSDIWRRVWFHFSKQALAVGVESNVVRRRRHVHPKQGARASLIYGRGSRSTVGSLVQFCRLSGTCLLSSSVLSRRQGGRTERRTGESAAAGRANQAGVHQAAWPSSQSVHCSQGCAYGKHWELQLGHLRTHLHSGALHAQGEHGAGGGLGSQLGLGVQVPSSREHIRFPAAWRRFLKGDSIDVTRTRIWAKQAAVT